MGNQTTLSADIADTILSMIIIEKKYLPGGKLPNENDLSALLEVSRTTLREAIRLLVAKNILEIKRGKGTFVKDPLPEFEINGVQQLKNADATVHDLYEMRMITEPQAAFYAALRGTEMELKRIAGLASEIEQKIMEREDRTELEHIFHQAIAKATHNEFMNQLIPVIQEAISKGVALSEKNISLESHTVQDHKMITDFLLSRNAEGAEHAMKIHILHAMEALNIK